MKRMIFLTLFGLTTAMLVVGCGGTDPAAKKSPEVNGPDEAGAKYHLASEPAGAKGVIDVRKSAKADEDVVIVGRIGGSKEPFTKGRVSFTIVDPSFVACSEKGEEDSETPWDFC